MKRGPSRTPRDGPPETEAWRIIFSVFALSGSLVIAWTLFVLFTDPAPRATRLGEHARDAIETRTAPATP
jgi:hypothetical protein